MILTYELSAKPEFLSDSRFGFKYVVGFTGSPYCDNDYLTDVIYRYPLGEAIRERWIKNVVYTNDTGESIGNRTDIRHIMENHAKNRERYRRIKPLTVLISRDAEHCEADRRDLIGHIALYEDVTKFCCV